jgi:fused signal recognition particle receptor
MQAEEFHKSVGIDATILTKVDADIKGGSALSVTYVTKKPILFIGTGQKYDDLEEFQPEKFVDMILR